MIYPLIKDYNSHSNAISKRLFQDNVTKEDIVPLRNIADIYQPQTIPTSELSDDYKYVVYGANGIIGRYDKYNHETSQICIACRGNSCGVINGYQHRLLQYQQTLCISHPM